MSTPGDPAVIIIGAGIAGLAAAYEVARRNIPVTILEAAPRAGGLIRTEHVDGFTIEAGPDSVLAQKPAALQLFDELGLGPRVISTTPPRTAYVLAHGRLHPLPSRSILGIPTTLRGIARYDLLSWRARARLALEPLARASSQPDESIASFFRRRFGPSTVDLIAQPLLGGIHAGDVEHLSMRSLFPRMVEAERRRGGVLRGGARPQTGGLFRSLSSGMAELVHALERRLPDGAIRYGVAASSIARAAGTWVVATAHGEVRAPAVIVATPAWVAASLFAPLDPEIAGRCSEVPYVSTVSVSLAWPRAHVRHPLAGSGFVVARRHDPRRITACTWVSSKWDGRAPAGQVLLRVFIGGSHDPDAADSSDDELVATAYRDVADILGIARPPVLARVFRWRRAGAQHTVGHLARLAVIEERLRHWPGLFVAGSGFRSTGIPDCVADGRAAGASASSFREDDPS
jgi:protoporphyrinogen/coproporphyrinogen III oxidase